MNAVRGVTDADRLAAIEQDVRSQSGALDAQRLAQALTAAIGFDRAEFRARSSAEDAFAFLRALVEASGVFVLLAGDCGHLTTAVEVSVFRGFAIADALAPFIVIND